MLLASFSFLLHFDKNGSLAPCVKKRTSSFFQFCFKFGHLGYPTRRAQEYYSYVGLAGGNYFRGH